MSVFARLFTAQVIALSGTGLLTVALGLLAYDLAGGAAGAVLGTALAIKMVAYVFVAPVMSAVTDRLHPRTVLVGADAVRAAIAVSLPLVAHTWQIFALVFVLQAASATFTPAFQAVIPAVLVDEREYTRGLSLSRLAYDLEAMLSPLLAAALVTVLSYSGLFVATAGGFLASALLVGHTAVPAVTRRTEHGRLRDRIVAGGRIMFSRNELRALLAMNLAVAAATALVLVNTVVYVRGLQGGSDADVALTLAVYGAGSMAVALSTPRLLTVMADRTLMAIGAVGTAAGLVVTAVVLSVTIPGPPVLMVLWATLGACTAMVTTPAGRLLARTGPDRSTVFTAQFSLSHAGFLLTYPIAGWVGAGVDHGLAAAMLAILATGAAVSAVCITVRGRGSSAMDTTPRAPIDAPSLVHEGAPDRDRLDAASDTFRMLADPTRLHLLWMLTQGEADVSALAEATGGSRTSISQHLAKLRFARLVDTRKDGRRVYYRLRDGHLGRLVREGLNHADHQVTGEPPHA